MCFEFVIQIGDSLIGSVTTTRGLPMTKHLFHRQLLHLIALLLLLGGVFAIINKFPPKGSWLQIDAMTWFTASICIPIAHQVYVWLIWRLELYGKVFTKRLGDAAFPLFSGGFSILFISRFIAIFGLAVATRYTGELHRTASHLVAIVLLFPSLFAIFSAFRYFGARRAFGADHFSDEFHKAPFETRGIYRFTSNGMYLYAFLIFYVPGFWFESWEAGLAALFSHLYIWVHFYCTELPDMEHIYPEQLKAHRDKSVKK